MREIYIFSEKITDKALNDIFENSIFPKIGNLDANVKTDLEELNRIFKDDLNLSNDDTGVMILQESDIDTAAFDAVYSSPVGRYTPATIEGKAGFVAMTENTAKVFPIARLILAIYKAQSVTFKAIKPDAVLLSPVISILMTVNNANFDLEQRPDIDRFITIYDELYRRNPHGKFSITQFVNMYNANKPTNKVKDITIEEMDNLISTYRSMLCVAFRDNGDKLDIADNNLIDMTREKSVLKTNGNIVNEYFYIHRYSFIKMLKEKFPDAVTYVPIPFNWLDLGMRATTSNNRLIFFLSKLIAQKHKTIDMNTLYTAAGALTEKQKFDARKKTERILKHHLTTLKTIDKFVVIDRDLLPVSYIDATAETIEITY